MTTWLRPAGTLNGIERPAHDQCVTYDADGFCLPVNGDPAGDRCWAPWPWGNSDPCVVCRQPMNGRNAMNDRQRAALSSLCERYKVPFDETAFAPPFDLPDGYVAGWVSTIYVGVSPEGEVSS